MTIDMQQFNAVFFEEVSEHLSNMESLLLDIDLTAPNLEDLNAVFRAAHSIKGGAGIFGFEDMIEVTHILETLLDKLRKEEITLSTEMIDAFLKAGDILTEQKNAHQEGEDSVDDAHVKRICEQLKTLSLGETRTLNAMDSLASMGVLPTKQISFLVTLDEDPDNLFTELAQYGRLTKDVEVINGFSKWQLQLADCRIESEALLDSIAFIAEPDSIVIKETIDNESDDFGLFDDDPSVMLDSEPSSQDFVLFDDAPSEVLSSEQSQQDAGLFDEDDVATHEPMTQEKGFGLFAEESVNEARKKARQEKTDGFGLFSHNDDEFNQRPIEAQQSHRDEENSALEQGNNRKRTLNKNHPVGENSIRVNTEKVDQLINQVGELVITQAMLLQISNELDPSKHGILLNRLTQLERNTRDLQESVMSIRMMPISFVFGRFPRVVRDLSSKLHKKIELRLVGDETELDKGLVEQLSDPLTHLIRNSIDHGIEMPEQRLANGKPEVGVITLFAFYEGGNVVINITDDGAGLNKEKILAKAVERGLEVNQSLTDNEIHQLIFSAGFSTAEKVTDVSGRGVGMDVVKRNIQAMGGQVEIQSEVGIGSTISIRLPLTLAILDGMSISVGKQIYIIPLTFISESLQPHPTDIKSINGKGTVVKVRGDYIPLVALHKLFNLDTEIKQACKGILVLLESNHKKIALLVDRLEGQQQVVLKSLETNFHAIPCISGATIMGDGTVALILDVAGLVGENS